MHSCRPGIGLKKSGDFKQYNGQVFLSTRLYLIAPCQFTWHLSRKSLWWQTTVNQKLTILNANKGVPRPRVNMNTHVHNCTCTLQRTQLSISRSRAFPSQTFSKKKAEVTNLSRAKHPNNLIFDNHTAYERIADFYLRVIQTGNLINLAARFKCKRNWNWEN